MPFRQKMCICMTDSITMNSNVYWHLDDSDSPGNVMPALSKITCNLSYVQYVIMQMIASVPEGLDLVQPVGLCPDRQTGKQTAHRGCNLRFRRVTQKRKSCCFSHSHVSSPSLRLRQMITCRPDFCIIFTQ